ncbi:MAG: hypothetical protein ACRCSP_07195 [Rhodoglobus sp.]
MALQPGVVRDEIRAALKKAGVDGASVADIHIAVQKKVGQEVPTSSVRSYLNLNTPTQFERISHGRYRLSNV